MKKDIYVLKRDGRKEPLNYEKINKVLEWSTDGISSVSPSDVAMNAKLQIFDGVTTYDIHRILIQSASDMITEDTPNYQYVASKLLNYLLRKEVFNTYTNFPRLKDFIRKNVDSGVYDSIILDLYSDKELDKVEGFIKHKRDEDLTYAGIQQLMDKYLVQHRKTGDHYETPQFMYMMISLTLFSKYKGTDRLERVKRFYELLSLQKISLPTPILAGVRTPNRQFSSCVLIDVDDDLDSIGASNHAVLRYISNRAGIGLNFRLRSIGSEVNDGEKVHTGLIPFLKVYESSVKSCSQGGIRGGAATGHYPFWHKEIMEILVLKNNTGNDLNRVRRMDHSIQLCRLFYRRFISKDNLSLFSPSDVPDLYEAFGYDNDKFEELYLKYENDKTISKIVVPAVEVMNLLLQERLETGRIYIQNLDNANTHSGFIDKINMSNLCLDGDTNVDIILDELDDEYINVVSKYNLEKIDNFYQGKISLTDVNDLYNELYVDSYNIENNIVLHTNGKIKVKCRNIETGEDEYSQVFASKLMNDNADVIKVTDENTGKYIICTEDHLVFTTNRGYVKAGELEETDELEITNEFVEELN
jgi:ribonucleoside-diphosphate reductase alpha chain